MAWPPPTLPVTRTNTTVMADTHPADHNAVNLAVNDIVRRVPVLIGRTQYGAADQSVTNTEASLHAGNVNFNATIVANRYTQFGFTGTVTATNVTMYFRVYYASAQQYLWSVHMAAARGVELITPPLIVPANTNAAVSFTVQTTGGSATIQAQSFQPSRSWAIDMGSTSLT